MIVQRRLESKSKRGEAVKKEQDRGRETDRRGDGNIQA